MIEQESKKAGNQIESLTVGRVRELLDYDPATGIFTRKICRGGPNPVGAVAGSKSPTKRYVYVRVDMKMLKGHRLAWFVTHGRWPSAEIDHINGDGFDNRISNLREATRSENMRNCGMKSNNTSGFKGCRRKAGSWHARITLQGRQYYLGKFKTGEAASVAYAEAAKKMHGEFIRGVQATHTEGVATTSS